MENYLFRKLKADELPILTDLFVYNDVENMIIQNTKFLKNRVIDIFCLFDGETLIGELRVKYKTKDVRFTNKNKRVYLYAFRIKENYQGNGLGKLLLTKVLRNLTANGYTEFTIGVENNNACAKHIYSSLGFIEKISTITECYQEDSYQFDLMLKTSIVSLKNQNRIMIIGCGGSGKSSLSKQLSNLLDLPVVHLDQLYWQAGWRETPKAEWIEKQSIAFQTEKWIADGNYGGTLNLRASKADTIIFLDFNRWLCSYRIIKRWMQNLGKVRSDMGEGCKEKVDFAFLLYVLNFPKNSRPIILSITENFDKQLIVLKDPKSVKVFLSNIKI